MKYALENNLNVVKVYQDNGISGSTMDRPQVQQMLKDMRLKKFNVILVTNLSRFSRNYIDAGSYIENVFPENKIRFIAVGDNYDSATYNDDISFHVRIWLNDMYRKDISKKIRYANERRAKTTYMNTGGIYGFKKVDGIIHIDEEQATVVRKIFDMYLSGISIGKIAKYLKDNKIYSPAYTNYLKTGNNRFFRGKTHDEVDPYYWPQTKIGTMLINREYNGVAINRKYLTINGIKMSNPNPNIVYNVLPKIIDDETFHKVQDKKRSNKINLIRTSNIDRLNNVYCEVCGSKLRFDAKRRTYVCAKCSKYVIKDNTLYKYLKQDLDKLISLALKDKNKIKKKLITKPTVNKELNNLIKQKNKVDQSIEMLFEQKINNSISEKVYFNKITNLNFENELLENKINLLNNESINNKDESKRIDDFINRINDNTISYADEDVSVFSKFIDKIGICKKDKNKFVIKLNYRFKL